MVMTASSYWSPPGTTVGVAGRRDSRTSSLAHVCLAQVRKENISLTTILSETTAIGVVHPLSIMCCSLGSDNDPVPTGVGELRSVQLGHDFWWWWDWWTVVGRVYCGADEQLVILGYGTKEENPQTWWRSRGLTNPGT